jgi:hypothetical protein
MAEHRSGDRNRDRSSSIFPDDDFEPSRRSGPDPRMSGRNHGSGRSDGDERGFLSRAGDEIRSWLGDDEAERRREQDARRWEQEHGTSGPYRGGGHEDQWTGRQPERSRSSGGGQDHYSNRSQLRPNMAGPGGYGQDDPGRGHGQSTRGGASGGWGEQPDFRSGPGMGQGFGKSGQSIGQSGQSFGQSFGQSGRSFGGAPHDETYRRWREQQIAQLDAEYEDYCRHRQQQFEQEFSSFRQTRQGSAQMSAGQAGSPGSGGQGSGGYASGERQMDAGSGTSGQQNAGSISTGSGNASAETASTGSSNPEADAASGTRSSRKS